MVLIFEPKIYFKSQFLSRRVTQQLMLRHAMELGSEFYGKYSGVSMMTTMM